MITVQLPSGHIVLMNSADDSDDGSAFHEVSAAPEPISATFDQMMSIVSEIGVLVREGVERAKPNKATAELSIAVDASTGQIIAFIGKASVTTSIKVTMEWSFDSQNA